MGRKFRGRAFARVFIHSSISSDDVIRWISLLQHNQVVHLCWWRRNTSVRSTGVFRSLQLNF